MRRERLERIGQLALPIVGGMVSQVVLNLVDTAMVGVLGKDALAGVGTASFAAFMATALVMGLSSGVQAMAARRVGEGRGDEAAVPLTGGLLLALVIGLPISIILLIYSSALFPYINGDQGVIEAGLPYFDARLLGVIAVGMNFAFRGYWTGVSQSRRYLHTLLVIHVSNVVISYVLIFGKFGFPELGTEGSGLGTTISLYLGTAAFFVLGWKEARKNGFLSRIPRRETMVTMLRLSVPAAIQEFLFAAGFTAIFWIVGLMGTVEVAATNILINLVLVAFLPAVGFGLAALTLVGEALGRGDPDEASRWAWDVVKVTALIQALLGLPALLVPDQIVMGAGAVRQVMGVAVGTQWLLGLPLAWLAGPYFGLGLFAVWATQAAYRILQAVIFVILWRRRGWTQIKL